MNVGSLVLGDFGPLAIEPKQQVLHTVHTYMSVLRPQVCEEASEPWYGWRLKRLQGWQVGDHAQAARQGH